MGNGEPVSFSFPFDDEVGGFAGGSNVPGDTECFERIMLKSVICVECGMRRVKTDVITFYTEITNRNEMLILNDPSSTYSTISKIHKK